MLNRRNLLGLVSAAPLAWSVGELQASAAQPAAPAAGKGPLLAGPPVVQHPAPDRFTVSFAVGQRATGWVEWGYSADRLDRTARASFRGLIDASEQALSIPVVLDAPAAGRRVYYRVVAQSLVYHNAYRLERGEPVKGPVRSIQLPDASAERVRAAMVSDTHRQVKTVAALAAQLDVVKPDLLVWAGDLSNDLNPSDNLAEILLKPGASESNPAEGGWASTRPLLFVPGNHDTRGQRARELPGYLPPWPGAPMPYNFALRYGPLALIGLDTGEDKPDAHPVFGGTAAYEPYREAQGRWLREALARPEIAQAPFKVVYTHIPLRGQSGEPDGLAIDGYAYWSGDGSRKWMPALKESKVDLIVSGHMHAWRIDEPKDGLPMQVVGGGPELDKATIVVVEAEADSLRVFVQDVHGRELGSRRIRKE